MKKCGIVNERIQQWREGKKIEAEDLLDVFITLKDEDGKPLLSDDEIKAQITVRISSSSSFVGFKYIS